MAKSRQKLRNPEDVWALRLGGLSPVCAVLAVGLSPEQVVIWLFGLSAALALLLVWSVGARHRERRQAREATQYRSIAQAAGDVFFMTAEGCQRIEWGSDLGAHVLGYEPGYVDLQPSSFDKWVENSDLSSIADEWAQLKNGEKIDVDLRLLRADGKPCWVHLLAIPKPASEEGSFEALGVLRATQDLHDIQAELAEARRLQTMGTMASGIAHEFNNHLTPIRGFIELALDTLGTTHSASEGLQTALNRVEYCAELVAQIQAYGRKSLLLPEAVQLSRLLPSVVRIAMSTDRERAQKVHLEEHYPPQLPDLWIDQAQFQQAIVQLILNALEAMPEGGRLTVGAESVIVDANRVHGSRDAKPGTFICVSIVDTGEGISPENLEHIFDPFFTTYKRADKRGMGLPMVQGMVAQHGGWLEIRSEKKKGTEVRVFLPLKKEEKRVVLPLADADGTMAVLPAAPLGRMLIGDDENLIRTLIRKVFEGEGWEVDEARDFGEVLSTLENGKAPHDLMVLDLAMTGPTAEDAVDQVKRARPDTNILIISGFGRDERVEELLKVTGGDFVSKPFSPKILLSKVDEIVAKESD